ncbi:MAG: CDP-glucose 4,6-dehydratase [Actinomycetota bacterium]|nr:CDP-glucose 4,6-dehydratase [Actinomycetota bacterium]
MHYLVTGHTGFKGTWLALMLHARGHQVSGIALDPVDGALYTDAGVHEVMTHDLRIDVCDAPALTRAVDELAPDAVVHLAAQALVRESYLDPMGTFRTNVNGTLNLLDATRAAGSVRAQLIITTDKVYRNDSRTRGYVETDPLGGRDPYSASKAMADLATQSWAASFDCPPTAIARAGNVVGGGDACRDRLLVDLQRGFAGGVAVPVRFPDAVRPWQHVLDCLNAYLVLVDALLEGSGQGEWNVAPESQDLVTVGRVADSAASMWGDGAAWIHVPGDHPHEAELLALDASKLRRELGWRERLPFAEGLSWTVDWALGRREGHSARSLCEEQIERFERLE